MPGRSRYELPGAAPTLPELGRIVRDIRQGRLNVTGEATLEAGTTTTVVTDREFGPTTVLWFTPRTAAAAAIRPWQASQAKGEITIGHAAPGTDVSYYYSAIG